MIRDVKNAQSFWGGTAARALSKTPQEGQGSTSTSVSGALVDVSAAEQRTHKRDFETMQLSDGGAVEGRKCDTKIRLLDDGDTEDRISNLPRELITSILAWLPVYDVAKTSILSKAWRDIWCTHPYLVLGVGFHFKKISKGDTNTDRHRSEFLRVFDMIFSVNTGPVLYFHLYVPRPFCNCHISMWIRKLTDKGVRSIDIEFEKKCGYILFSALFDCADLTRLKLANLILGPPLKSRTFTNLTIVRLDRTSIPLHMSFGAQLQDLHLLCCSEIEHLDCQFTNSNNLRRLCIYKSTTIEWRWFECTSKLEALSLVLTTANSNIKKVINLVKLISKIPSLHSFFVDGPSLVVFGPDPSILTTPTMKAVNLKNLVLNRLGLYNLCQISNFLGLIRSFPNLQCLCIGVEHGGKSLNPTEPNVERYLGSLENKDIVLCQLEIVKISGVVGSRYVLDFIKLLLASSRLLRVMLLSYSSQVEDLKEKLRIKHEVENFPRLSLEAKLIWKKHVVGEMHALCFAINSVVEIRSIFQKFLLSNQ
ncbi:F-box domain-containing protein [Heracleum sosnowskyi]|uniref:F-box domain-containing protein n=1 Tax=Heracleum sosnowskyi TaxID=360622 RepID=A0AAD8IM04_9APIA|nr:F-box domain-containing protein [Heracleum sosnowskyi]